MNKSELQQSQNISILGIIVTILVTVGFVWAGSAVAEPDNRTESQSSTMQANEHRAFFESAAYIAGTAKIYPDRLGPGWQENLCDVFCSPLDISWIKKRNQFHVNYNFA